MTKVYIYRDSEYGISSDNIFLSTEYKDISLFRKYNPDMKVIAEYNTKDVFAKTIRNYKDTISKKDEEIAKLLELLANSSRYSFQSEIAKTLDSYKKRESNE